MITDALLQTYCALTAPARHRRKLNLIAEGQMPAAILFYHRVADTDPNGWTISRRDFLRHLQWIEAHASFATLSEIAAGQRRGYRDRLQVAITFDDGYAENSEWVIDELVRRKIPCTYFVSVEHVLDNRPFDHDRDRGRPLPVNSVEQIREMSERGIEVGCHSWSHPDFGHVAARALQREIADARKTLQEWTGQSIDYFAFPYGQPHNITQAAIDEIARCGFRGFVSAYGGWNWPGGDDFHLQRIHGDPGLAKLVNWLTLDRRKLHRQPLIRYERLSDSRMSPASEPITAAKTHA